MCSMMNAGRAASALRLATKQLRAAAALNIAARTKYWARSVREYNLRVTHQQSGLEITRQGAN